MRLPRLYDCPECALPCTVDSRGSVASSAGPVELVRVRCVARHHFLMPAEAVLFKTCRTGAAYGRRHDI